MIERLDALRARASLREWRFTSGLPVIGGLVVLLRRSHHAVAGEWALRDLIQQQSAFNHEVIQCLDYLHQRVENLERQAVDADRADLQSRRHAAEQQNATTREIAALCERLERLEAIDRDGS